MTLWEVADFLKGQGVINAINLDGDGSSTYMANGSLASYPSDHCVSDPMWCCPRRVSTILCVHQPQCQPEDCSGHGMGTANGWSGTGCDTLVCQPPACGAHGVCTQDGCACDAGWRGENCSQAALTGARVTLFTVAAAAPLVSMANPVNKSIPWVCTGWTVGRSASARTCAHVTRSQEAATPCSRERRTTAYMGPPVTPAPALSTSSCSN
ncbi:N-acetylglucosamine-1-phosphodiester alpha-N-acetylglucosaminidase-like isoform X1 [Salvelinus alpinus]